MQRRCYSVLVALTPICVSACDAQPPTSAMSVPGALAPTGAMTTIRAAHTATLLPNGRVLLAGGCTAQSCERSPLSGSTELYDPASGAFARGPRMSVDRVGGSSATLLRNGQVLIVGGWSERPTSSAELYDPGRDRMVATGTLRFPRADASATLLVDGRVLIVGGYDGSERLASAELYDPVAGTFSMTGSMSVSRAGHAAVLLADGRVLIVGGERSRGVVLSTAEVYDPASGIFLPAGEMSVVRYKHAAVRLADGRVLVVGGSDARDGFGRYDSAELWDSHSRSFTAAGMMHGRRYKIAFSVVLLNDGTVLVAGGAPQAERFDPTTRAFSVVSGDLGGSYAFSSATVLSTGDVLVAGGYDDRIRLTDRAYIFRSR